MGENKVDLVITKGGSGSGHHGHSGRPGKRGGSTPGSGGSALGTSPVRLSLETSTGRKNTVWTNEKPTKENTETLQWVHVLGHGNTVREGTGHDFTRVGMMDLGDLNIDTAKYKDFSTSSDMTKYLREQHGVEYFEKELTSEKIVLTFTKLEE